IRPPTSASTTWSAGTPSGCPASVRRLAQDSPRRVRQYLLRRVAFGLTTVFGVSLIIFVVVRVLPGDPLVAMFGVEGATKLAPADRAKIMQDLGLSDPLPVQYVHWLRDIASGSLGKSFFRGDKVSELIMHRGPLSAQIGLLSVLISWLIGLPIGIISA